LSPSPLSNYVIRSLSYSGIDQAKIKLFRVKIFQITPPSTGFFQVELDQDVIDYLWKIIDKAKLKKEDYKSKLAGNINESFAIHDENNFFYNKVCIPLVEEFRIKNHGNDPFDKRYVQMEFNTPLLLNEFWVNYQYQTEFNPFHQHGGVYSFAIWLKIPYDWNEQIELPQFKGTKKEDRKAGIFEFEYIDSLGSIRSYKYHLTPKFEGSMVFFPAALRHSVYPFFGTKEPRVSISGNLWYDTTKNLNKDN